MEDIYRQRTNQEIEQEVIAVLAGAYNSASGEIVPVPGGKPWSNPDLAHAIGYMASLFTHFARHAEHEGGISFSAFLQHEALAAAADREELPPAPGPLPGITLADSTGDIVFWLRVTPDGRLDAGGDTSKWTEAAASFIAELRRQAALGTPPGQG
jgi:hypothetical protein